MQRAVVPKLMGPSNAIWGPALWTILHSSCERIGSSGSKQDEPRIWIGLLQRLRYSLPCPQCKKHYTAYMANHPIPSITKDAIRTWLYELHHEVNQRLGKPSIDDLSIYERPFDFTIHYTIFHEHMLAALRNGWCSREDIQHTVRLLTEMKCIYDFF